MEESILAIIGALFVIPVALLVTVIYIRKFSNEERLKLIETGADPEILNIKRTGGKYNTLRFALLLMGVGTGILLGGILDSAFDMEEVGYFSMLFICGGIGLGIAYRIENNQEK